ANNPIRTISINWTRWQPGESVNKTHDALTPSEGIAVLDRVMRNPFPRVVVTTYDLVSQMERINHPGKPQPNAPTRDSQNPETLPVSSLYQRPQLSTPYEAPRDEVEHSLADVWRKFFAVKDIGIHDDFFELGGDSLKAITVVTQLHKTLNTRIPITQLFQSPTIRQLARYVKTLEPPHEYSHIPPAETREYYPMSSAQRRMFILQQVEPDGTGYNNPLLFDLQGPLDPETLEHSFQLLVERHEILRTSFQSMEGETVQRVHPRIVFTLDHYDITGAGPREEELIRHFIRPFDLSGSSQLRVGLIRFGPDRHLLMSDMHHIITDGSSIGILVREFMTLYDGAPLPPLRIQYKDFSQWQAHEKQKDSLQKQENYWLNQFRDQIPVLDLPIDFPRPSVQSFQGNTLLFQIQGEEAARIKRIVETRDVTLFMVLLSIYYVLLYRVTGQEDIVIGTPFAARTHADLRHVIGILTNTLTLRNQPAGEKTFTAFLTEVKQNTLAAFENQDYLFEDLVEHPTLNINRDAGRTPVFDVLFNLFNFDSQYETGMNIETPELKLTVRDHDREVSLFDLGLQAGLSEEGFWFSLEFCTKLFKPATAERFTHYFKRIVSAVTASQERKLSDIEIISPEEKQKILHDFNDSAGQFPQDKAIQQLFIEQAHRTPDGIAVVSNTNALTYRELLEQTIYTARLLNENGVEPGNIVALMMEPGIELVSAMMAILGVGAVYLPVPLDYPQERVEFMLRDSAAKIILTNSLKVDWLDGLTAILILAFQSIGSRANTRFAPTGSAFRDYGRG
ncbi:MAG: AMP-binding protein, partial [bacterium]|nr:AMP-binding protein [bacterium]